MIYSVQRTFATRSDGDDFLRMLADGGFQFEKLVRHAWPGETLEGSTSNAAASHAKTIAALRACVKAGKGVLHEAVFVSDNLFARVDMLRVNGKTIELCEIKAKSYAGPDDPENAKALLACTGDPDDIKTSMLTKATKNNPSRVRPAWLKYIADIGFQTIVVERALAAEKLKELKGLTVSPRLLVSNKNQVACAHDWFGNVVAVIDPQCLQEERKRPGLRFVKDPPVGFRSALIAEVNVEEAIEMLRTRDAQSDATRWKGKTLDQLVDDACQLVRDDVSVDPATERGWKCRGCQFNTPATESKQCGFDVCWGTNATSARNLFQLYYGRTYTPPELGTGPDVNEDDEWVNHVVSTHGKGNTLKVADLSPEGDDTGKESGKSRVQRRTRQIKAARANETQFSDDFASIVKARLMPKGGTGILRFMDFETTSACLPYAIGMYPYQVVAFQFSVHSLVVKNDEFDLSRIHHVESLCIGESTDRDIHDQDVAFATSLKEALTEPWDGVNDEVSPVFHWASHERTVMRMVSERLSARGGHDDLVQWLNATCAKEDNDPPGRLLDLLKLAEANTFHPLQQGRFSIKKFLPALCSSDDALKVIADLKFDMSGLDADETGCRDPYKSLHPIADFLGDSDTGLVTDDDDDDEEAGEGIRNGTSAMRAYQQLRFSECVQWKDANKKPIDNVAVEKALLKYCELDTAAMVVVWWWLWTKANR